MARTQLCPLGCDFTVKVNERQWERLSISLNNLLSAILEECILEIICGKDYAFALEKMSR